MELKKIGYALLAFAIITGIYTVIESDKNNIAENTDSASQAAAIAGSGSGLVAYYTFDDGTGIDSSGNGRNGILVNEPTYVAGGVGNGAMQFDGIDDYINVGDIFYSDSLTVCTWVNPAVIDENIKSLVIKRNSSGIKAGANEWMMVQSSEGFQYAAWSATGDVVVDLKGPSLTSNDLNKWSHVCAVQQGDGKESYLYVNGSQVNSVSQSGIMANKSGHVQIAARTNNNSQRYFNGSMDEVRIYNRALSSSEISEIYSLTQTSIPEEEDPVPPTPVPEPEPESPADTTAPVISSVQSSSITTSSVIISWNTDEDATSKIDYGLTINYSNSTIESSIYKKSHSVTLTGLQANTIYNYRVVSKDSSGNVVQSNNFSFKTSQVVSNANPVINLDMQPPDSLFSGGTYYEGTGSFPMVTASNKGSATWKLTDDDQEPGNRVIYLNVPGNPEAVKDPNAMSRREWRFGRLKDQSDQWYRFRVKFASDHQNPEWYGTILSQVKASGTGYGFFYGLYMNKSSSATGPIPMAYRFMEGSGSGAVSSDVTYDSGVISTGFSFNRNQWYDIVVNYKLSESGGSYYKVWVDGVQKINVTNRKVGQTGALGDLRVGSYGRYEKRTRSLYIDGFVQGSKYEDLYPNTGEVVTTNPTPEPTPTTNPTPTTFSVGARVENTVNINVRTSGVISSATLIGTNPAGTKGTLIQGPSTSSANQYTWWYVDYDSGYDGWSGENNLKLIN